MKKIFLSIGLFFLFINAANAKFNKAVVFFNEACSMCGIYVKHDLPRIFNDYGIKIDYRDYVNERGNRKILNDWNKKWDVPFDLQSHIGTFIDDKLLLGGHVPEKITRYLIEHPQEYDKILVYQDKMHGDIEDYKVWNFKGDIKTYNIGEPITTYLDFLKENPNQSLQKTEKGFLPFLFLITVSAFFDGLNPCAFAVLLFFIAFLFTIKKTKVGIWKMGVVYIFAIFLAYFLIGIGIAQAFIISGYPHLMAKVGAYLVIVLGVVQFLGVIFPRFPIRLKVPTVSKGWVEKWLHKATLPAAFIGGFVVGLCTFPCSGGIYVAIIGLLASTKTYMQGLGWMIWYNLIFVSPLFILLALAGNKKTTEYLARLERRTAIKEKILVGITMMLVGIIILVFFT